MTASLDTLFALCAAVHRGEIEAMPAAAAAVEQEHGPGATRELLRQLHLYFGFPRIVQALNACAPALAAPTAEDAASAAPAQPRAAGEQLFRKLYAEDADKVLPHLERLDPCFQSWILEHAYARVLARPRLDLATKERIAIACLAATRCWKQWESHQAIARRHGVSLAVLRQDLRVIEDWIGRASVQQAEQALDRLSS